MAERNKALPAQSGKKSGTDANHNDVQIVDRSYLQKNFKAQSEIAQNLIEDVIGKFKLNSEQERAFRIIANHAVTPGSEHLMMYVGGMAGTGKSQVIKALIDILNPEMNLIDLLFWHPQELQQLFCMYQLITQF